MVLISSLIPFICVTPATPEVFHPDPYSPFPSQTLHVEDDGYRAIWLSLPPLPPWQSSSLPPANRPPRQGLTHDQFTSLLKMSRDRGAKSGSSDVHKELVLQSQALKQLERRVRFLSKVNGRSCVSSKDPPSARRHSSEHPALEVTAQSSDDLNAFNPAWDKRGEKQPLASSTSPPVVTMPRRIPPSLEEITAYLRPVHVSSNRECYQSPSSSNSLPSSSLTDRMNHQSKANSVLNHGAFDATVKARDTAISRTVGVAAGPALHTGRTDTARDMIVTLMRRSSPPLRPVLDEWHGREEIRLIAAQ